MHELETLATSLQPTNISYFTVIFTVIFTIIFTVSCPYIN